MSARDVFLGMLLGVLLLLLFAPLPVHAGGDYNERAVSSLEKMARSLEKLERCKR